MFEARFVDTPRGRFRVATLGSGPDLLVLHTLRNQLEYAQLIAPALAKRFTVHVIDMPGHGQSSKDLDRPFDAERFIGDVQAFIEAEDLSGLIVMGESIGGSTALALGARIPERLGALAVFNPHDGIPMLGGWRGRALSRVGRYTAMPFKTETAGILRGVLSAAFYDPDRLPDDYLALLVESGKDPAYPAVMKSVMAHQASWPAVRSLYSEIPAELPVLLAYGDHDWASEDAKRANAQLIPSVDEFISLEQTGHWSFLEQPERVAQLVTT